MQEVTYNQLLVGANGLVVFPPSGFMPGGYDGYSWGGYTSDLYSIQFQQDIHPGLGGTICYRTIGTAPNRCFVVQYCNVPYFSCTSLLFTGELRLCENGSIQINIQNKPTCSTWNSGGALIGIVGASGDVNAILNATNSPVLNNTCYAFTPPLSCQVSSPPAGCVPLPVLLESFDATLEGGEVYIRWQSTEERGISRYQVERSGDLRRWEPVGFLPARGQASSYELKDGSFPSGYASLYYRLVVEDGMGGEVVYGPAEVVLSAKRPIRPQSFEVRGGEPLRLRLDSGEEVKAILYDAQGRRTFEGRFNGPGEVEIPGVFFGRGFNLLLLEVVGGERAAYRILGL